MTQTSVWVSMSYLCRALLFLLSFWLLWLGGIFILRLLKTTKVTKRNTRENICYHSLYSASVITVTFLIYRIFRPLVVLFSGRFWMWSVVTFTLVKTKRLWIKWCRTFSQIKSWITVVVKNESWDHTCPSFPFSYKMTHGLFYFKYFFNLPLCSRDSQGWMSYYVLLIGGKNSIIKDILESRQVKKSVNWVFYNSRYVLQAKAIRRKNTMVHKLRKFWLSAQQSPRDFCHIVDNDLGSQTWGNSLFQAQWWFL